MTNVTETVSPLASSATNSSERVDGVQSETLKEIGVLFASDADTADGALSVDVTQVKRVDERKHEVVWRNVIIFIVMHASALYGVYHIFHAKLFTIFFSIFLYSINMIAITAGCHRLWSHRSYKAKDPLRALLIFFNLTMYQLSAFHWARDHRIHHKFTDTDADPHNSTRGFFFCHIGWVLSVKFPEVVAKGKSLDLSDLYEDRILMFEDKYYFKLMPFLAFLLPTIIPMYMWNENFINSWCLAIALRMIFVWHSEWSINSVSHMYGMRPYDKNINPTQNVGVSIFAFGEGWHNYHHAFPWDYKAAEWGDYSLNFATAFIDLCAKIGWAYDLKSVSPAMIEKRVKRTGDGTHAIWGWDDKNLSPECKQNAIVLNKKEH
uniref:Fatty acid desaturase domain-containing protein n=1 Tax=Glossina brevipalpis TaxID=37001 RepID=A0A1A9WAU5_9MUSC